MGGTQVIGSVSLKETVGPNHFSLSCLLSGHEVAVSSAPYPGP